MVFAGQTEVIEKEFTPDMAGERVGWISVARQEREDESDLVHFDAAVGFVGEDGAVVSYVEYEEGKRGYHSESTRGFMGGVCIGGTFIPERGVEDASQVMLLTGGQKQIMSDRPLATSQLIQGGTGMHHYADVDMYGGREWITGGKAFTSEMKRQLEANDASKAYPYLYYMLNQASGNSGCRPTDAPAPLDIKDWLFPDVQMFERTQVEKDHAKKIVDRYEVIKQVDEDMLCELENATNVASLARDFQMAREEVSIKEIDNWEAYQQMTYGGAVWLPISYTGGGRSWPYMDPMGNTARTAYGLEYDDIRNGDASRAIYELKEELKVLERRDRYALAGAELLVNLASAEAVQED